MLASRPMNTKGKLKSDRIFSVMLKSGYKGTASMTYNGPHFNIDCSGRFVKQEQWERW